jgi:hypothetical protein
VARPTMRDPHGRWSLLQLADAAGITHRRARDLTEAGYLPDDLHSTDILRARVADAIHDAVRPPGQTRTASAPHLKQRNLQALDHATHIATNPQPTPDALLLITPTTATLNLKVLLAAATLEDATQPVLVIPLGRWDTELRTFLATLTTTPIKAAG